MGAFEETKCRYILMKSKKNLFYCTETIRDKNNTVKNFIYFIINKNVHIKW